jgi:hypothetical protein
VERADSPENGFSARGYLTMKEEQNFCADISKGFNP